LAGISIQAPPACLTAGPIASPMALQSVIVNGTTCNGATVTHSASGMAIYAPPACLVGPPPAPVKLLSAKSRKTHGAAGTFDVAIEPTAAMDGNIAVEPRAIGAGHLIVFEFDGAITSAGIASAVDSTGAAVSVNVPASPPGNLIFVTMPAVSDGRRVTISLAGINGVSSAHASIGFLLGDVNNSRVVNAADLATVKANSGQLCNAANFKNDLKASGRINVADIAGVKARLGATLAP
jgi:hypothetical protein